MLPGSLERADELCGYEETVASRGYQRVAEAENEVTCGGYMIRHLFGRFSACEVLQALKQGS